MVDDSVVVSQGQDDLASHKDLRKAVKMPCSLVPEVHGEMALRDHAGTKEGFTVPAGKRGNELWGGNVTGEMSVIPNGEGISTGRAMDASFCCWNPRGPSVGDRQ